jgi:hypothetical protein
MRDAISSAGACTTTRARSGRRQAAGTDHGAARAGVVRARLLGHPALAERDHANIVSWTEFDRGGHYPAHQVPELLVGDLRQFFAGLRG